jgi:radial spoke head protein 4A
LNAKINSNPPFPGKERHLLRSQLARIFHATTIAPNKMYEIDEETNLMKFSDEFVMPSTEELKAAD